jgi:hypothetical protein
MLFGLAPLRLPTSALRDAPKDHSVQEKASLDYLRSHGLT